MHLIILLEGRKVELQQREAVRGISLGFLWRQSVHVWTREHGGGRPTSSSLLRWTGGMKYGTLSVLTRGVVCRTPAGLQLTHAEERVAGCSPCCSEDSLTGSKRPSSHHVVLGDKRGSPAFEGRGGGKLLQTSPKTETKVLVSFCVCYHVIVVISDGCCCSCCRYDQPV